VHYKVKYKDSKDISHVRYYHALNATTAREMFRQTVLHSIGGPVKSVVVYQATGTEWKKALSD